MSKRTYKVSLINPASLPARSGKVVALVAMDRLIWKGLL